MKLMKLTIWSDEEEGVVRVNLLLLPHMAIAVCVYPVVVASPNLGAMAMRTPRNGCTNVMTACSLCCDLCSCSSFVQVHEEMHERVHERVQARASISSPRFG